MQITQKKKKISAYPVRFTVPSLATAGAVLLAFGVLPANAASLFATNLIVNGDAETRPGSASGYDIEPVPGWTTTGNFTVVQYATYLGNSTTHQPGFCFSHHYALTEAIAALHPDFSPRFPLMLIKPRATVE